MARRALVLWVLLALGLYQAYPASEAIAQPPDPLTLEWCLAEAARVNPDIAVDEADAEAAAHRVRFAGALEDPRIRYEASNLPVGDFNFDSTMMSGNQLGLSQRFPFPGVLGNRKKAAQAAAEAAGSGLVDRQITVAAAVETAYAQLAFAQRALDITDRNIALLRQLTRIAETKYEVGLGLQQDVLRAQVELTRLLDERLVREEDLASAEARLNALLDRPAEAPFPRAVDLRDDSPLPALGTLLQKLEETSPALHALKAKIDEAERLKKATVREGYPDFDVGLGYRIRSDVTGDPVKGDDFVSAGVTIRLPLNRRKWRGMIAEREALLRRARAAHRAALTALRARLRSSFAQLQRADGEVALVETGLLPQARQSLESSRSGYEVDKVDFLSLVDSQIRLLEAELRLVRAMADRRMAYAALEAAAGEKLR